jgi:hypothetical protein
VKGK